MSQRPAYHERMDGSGPVTRLVCVHSLAAHGAVGVKPFLVHWGAAVAPVPSLLLTGPADMAGCRRVPSDLGELLDGTLDAARARGERPWLFVGYLASAGQVDVVDDALARHHDAVAGLVVDPVCGDDGRAYVSHDLVAAWPRLLARAAIALPNVTEVELLTGAAGDAGIATLRARHPRLELVVTGASDGGAVVTRAFAPGDGGVVEHRHARVPGRTQGAGDLFAAVWCHARLIEGDTAARCLERAATAVATALRAEADARRSAPC